MNSFDVTPDVAALRAIAPIKTWSLLVTVFGDQQASQQNPLTGAFLNGLFQEMGFKPAALRVALHRLAKDDWIKSCKTGRTSEYHLTVKGMAETERARERVYSRKPASLEDWHCLIFQGPVDGADYPNVQLSNTVLAAPKAAVPANTRALFVGLRGAQVPPWIDARCLNGEMWRVVDALLAYFQRTGSARPHGDGQKQLAVRMLALHHWRRLVLRDGYWLHRDLNPGGKTSECQSAVLDAIETLAADACPALS